MALQSHTSRKKDFGRSKGNPLGNFSAGEFQHQPVLLSLPWAPRAHKPEGGDPEISAGTVTRQQAAPAREPVLAQADAGIPAWGLVDLLGKPWVPLLEVEIVSICQGFPGRRSWLTGRAQRVQGARKVQRGAGEGWGREAGPARRQQPAPVTTLARLRPQQKTPRPLPPPLKLRAAGD